MFLLSAEVFPWDLAVALGIGGMLCVFIWSAFAIKQAKRWKHRFFITLLGLLGFLGFLTLTWGTFIEPRTLVITREKVSFPYPQPLRIAVLSDQHVGPYSSKAFMEKIVARTNAERPDVVFLVGDYIHSADSALDDLQPLQDLEAPMGVYAVLGNHDVGMYRLYDTAGPFAKQSRAEDVTAYLEKLDITMLRNEHTVIPTSRGPVAVAGIDDLWTGHADLEAAMEDIPLNAPVILLSHNPDVIQEERSSTAHLILAGHTHGGQIRLPLLGPVPSIPTHLGKAYDQGIFHVDSDTTLAITRGTGQSGPRARLFAPPEILILETEPE